jgi:hypothetical protein
MADNRTLLQKADLAVSDLITDGGYLLPDQAATLVQGVVDQAVLMGMIDVRSIASHTQSIGKIAIDGHVLRPGNSGRRLTTTERVKPTTDEVELATKLYKAQINLNDETVEDAVGGGTLTSLVQSMLQEYIAWDLDQLLAAGDTASTDAFLAMMDGLIKLATSNTVNASDNYLSKTYLRNGLLAMPSKYSKDKARQRWLTSTDQEIRYRDAVSDRIGALGDVSLQDENPLRYGGRPLLGIQLALHRGAAAGPHAGALRHLAADPHGDRPRHRERRVDLRGHPAGRPAVRGGDRRGQDLQREGRVRSTP